MSPSRENHYYCDHILLISGSYCQLIGQKMAPSAWHSKQAHEFAEMIFNAPFALISHGTETEPVFNYANKTAMRLFNMGWDEITALPSKYSAEQPDREQRVELLQEVKNRGFIENYAGVRIAKGGRRFYIEQATVWNLTDSAGAYYGQAAMFSDWRFL